MSRAVGAPLAVLALAVLAGCQAGASTGASCTRTSECASPLVCTYGRCRAECVTSRDCAAGLRCIENAGATGVCTLEVEERCTDAICAAPLLCRGGQCRTECTTSADCRSGTCDGVSCVEPRSGDDAGAPSDDAGTPTDDVGVDAATAGCDVQGHTALLDALLGPGHGPAGLEVLAPTSLGTYVSPQEGGAFVVGQVALASRPTADFPRAWVALLDQDLDRGLRVIELRANDLGDPRPFHPVDTVTPIAPVRTFALATDRDVFRGVAALVPPTSGTETSAWIFEPGTTDLMLSQITPMVMYPGQQPGRVAVVGGASPFTATTGSAPLWYAFRETHEDGTTSTQVLGGIDRGIGVGSYEFVPTAGELPNGFLETSASYGPLLVAYDGTSDVVAWDLRPARSHALVHLVTDASGPPAIAFDVDDDTSATLVYPSGNDLRAVRLACPAGGLMDCHAVAGTTRTISLGAPTRRVAATSVLGGTVAAVLLDDGGDRIVHVVLGPDAARVDDCDGGCAPLLDARPAGSGETVEDLRVAAAPSPMGVAITIAALVRDETRGLDRVWLDGLWLCSVP